MNLWYTKTEKRGDTVRKAIFWDLQGTLGGDATGSIEQFEPYPFAKDALRLAKENGYYNLILTNQSRIGKGLLSRTIYEREAARILQNFNQDEPLVEEILCCPHQESDHCHCKKPKTGLIESCIQKYSLSLSDCVVIGDMGKNEIIMAHHAGCCGVLVLTGGGKASLGKFRSTWAGYEAHIIAENAWDAIQKLLCSPQ